MQYIIQLYQPAPQKQCHSLDGEQKFAIAALVSCSAGTAGVAFSCCKASPSHTPHTPHTPHNITIGGREQKLAVVALVSCSAGTAAAAADAAPRRTLIPTSFLSSN